MPTEVSDEERRKLLIPNISNDEIVAIIKAYFTYPGHDSVVLVKELDSYDDRNWWMKISGVNHLVKVHNGVESGDAVKAIEASQKNSVIHFQYAMMKTLKEHGVQASFPVQMQLKDASKNEPFVHSLPVISKDHSPCELVVSVYTWVDGITMSSLKVLPLECIVDAGRFLGHVQNTLKSMSTDYFPPAKRYHQWDGKNTKDLTSFLHCIDNGDRRNLVENIIQTFDKELILSGVANAFRKGINHGDYNDANILLDSGFKVTGVIDFGDSVESWSVLDVSVGMAYSMLSSYGKPGRSASAAAAFLRGFHSVYPLTETERKHLVLLIACRLACSVTLGAYSYQQNPENKYLLVHAEPAWEALEFVWGSGDQTKRDRIHGAMNSLFDLACQDSSSGGPGRDERYCSDLAIPDAHICELQSTLAKQVNAASMTQQKI